MFFRKKKIVFFAFSEHNTQGECKVFPHYKQLLLKNLDIDF